MDPIPTWGADVVANVTVPSGGLILRPLPLRHELYVSRDALENVVDRRYLVGPEQRPPVQAVPLRRVIRRQLRARGSGAQPVFSGRGLSDVSGIERVSR